MKKNLSLALFLFLAFSPITNVYARLVQILHTNDTHSFLDNSVHDKNRGGMERLKTMIDAYKSKMEAVGVKSLVMDAGDFLEGNIYYMAEKGRKTFQIHNEIGYDVAIMGNHDWLMGTNELNKILGEFDLKYKFITANLEISNQHPNLKEKIKPYAEFNIDGIKIGVVGITTDEIFYKWRFERGLITNPLDSAVKYEQILKERGNDAIIALTHIGVFSDRRMVARSRYIDLVVGGHSHDALYKEKYEENRDGRQIPIVQAGAHTEYLGRILVDIEKGKPLKIVKYELIPLNIKGDNESIKSLVAEADVELETLYGKEWLEKKVGISRLKPGDDEGMKKWASFIGKSIKDKVEADIAIHVPPMNGENYPVGDVNRRDLFNSFPRVLDINDKYGWNIYTSKVRGVWLRLTIESLSLFGQPLILSGIDVDYIRTPLGFKIRKMRVNGERINPFKNYTVAFTEGIVKGAQGVDDRTVAILRHPKDTKIKIWQTLEEKLEKEEVPASVYDNVSFLSY